ERIFKHFDLNGDGKISATELGNCLKTLGSVTVEEVKRMMDEIDTDGDDYIFLPGVHRFRPRQPQTYQRRRQNLLSLIFFSI
ncbi:Polcalcin Syr v 3, partial [Linum perenne]